MIVIQSHTCSLHVIALYMFTQQQAVIRLVVVYVTLGGYIGQFGKSPKLPINVDHNTAT